MTTHLMQTFSRLPVAFTHGQGVWLWDTENKRYLDAVAGIGVCGLGHNHPKLVQAITEQAGKLIHCSNLYEIPLQETLAEKITQISGMTEVFFANSGSEANEGAIKLARLYGHKKGIEKPVIITMDHSWHGRTIATLAATGNAKAKVGFGPFPEGFVFVPHNNLEAIQKAHQENPGVVAVILEVVQGEGGIHVADLEYLQQLRTWCTENQCLLIIDEVQAGIARTGKWLAYQWADIVPDVITSAKGLGGGVPIAALAARGAAANVLTPGTHGTTFGGNPLVCAAAYATLMAIEKEGLLANALQVGQYLQERLQKELSNVTGVKSVRGKGLMIGIELDRPCAQIVTQALQNGLLVNVTRESVIRLLPPLILGKGEADKIVETLAPLIRQFLQ